MDKIINELKALKNEIVTKNVSMRLIDDVNRIIGMCEKKKQVLDALTEPVPSQIDMIPAAGLGEIFNPSFVIEHATINIYGSIPPTLDEN